MFATGSFLKVWQVTDKGNYLEVDCSTNKRNIQTGKYETDFASKFVRFVGEAFHKRPQANERIKITSCGVTNVYEKDGQKQYLKNPTYIVFNFERDGINNNQPRVSVPNSNGAYTPSAYTSPSFTQPPNFEQIDDSSEDLPF